MTAKTIEFVVGICIICILGVVAFYLLGFKIFCGVADNFSKHVASRRRSRF